MTQEHASEMEFDLGFEDFDAFDALAELDGFDEDEDDGGDQVPKDRGIGLNPNPVMPEHEDTRTPDQKLADLFSEMQPYRSLLIKIMDFCLEPHSSEDVFQFIADAQSVKHPVYSPANFCNFLERSEALWRVFEDGAPYDYEPQAETVVIDGVEYLQPAEPPAVWWLTSPAGVRFLEQDDPMSRAMALLDSEQSHADVLRVILGLAAAEGGTSAKALAAAIDRNPEFKARGVFSSKFVDLLHKADALEWKGCWSITPIGLELQAALDQATSPADPEN
ncbi:MAG: hypothetical protein PUD02_01205 [Eggerthellales bacterium]|nr:hypothetical protein [Eggerthellales bacterium]